MVSAFYPLFFVVLIKIGETIFWLSILLINVTISIHMVR